MKTTSPVLRAFWLAALLLLAHSLFGQDLRLKDAWPFLWYENEYVVDAATSFILAAGAANELGK